MNESEQINLFYSYAHNDEPLRNELDKHLSTLRKRGIIAQWYDRNISAGTEWADQIDHHLNTAQIVLLLISSDFLASDYCYSVEMKRALERHDLGEARVIPILIRPVDWQGAPFAKLQFLPQNALPVTAWANQDLAFVDIAMQIRKVASELQVRFPLHLKSSALNPDSQKPLKSVESKLMGAVEKATRNLQHEYVSPPDPYVVKQFRLCQKRVEELKSIHNMLHEIEVQLAGLAATIQLITPEVRKKKKVLFKGSSIKSDNKSSMVTFSYVEIMWRQTVLKIDDLAYFAAETMEMLEDERFCFDSDVVRGPLWMTELFFLQQSFETSMKDQDGDAVRNLSAELLTKCRTHLYRIDKRLLDAVKELELASDVLLRYTA